MAPMVIVPPEAIENTVPSFSGGTITIGAITLSGDLGCLDLTVAGNASVGTNLTVSGDVELGHASDTTIARASAGDVNIEGNKIYRAGGTDVPVADGGMGASSHTDGGVLLGSGSGAITAMAVLGNGAIIIGDNSTDPVAVSAFTASNGVLKVENGGTETNALTDHAVLIGSGTGPVTPLAVGTDGTVLRGSTGADPSFGAIEEGDVNIADAPSDEDILTYEAGSTNFEWHTFDEKAAGMSAGALPSDSVPRGDASTNLRTKVCCKDIEGFNASQEEYIFVAPYDCTIVKVGLVCDTATTGSDASVTNWSFQVANLTISSNLLSAAKTTGATEITGDALYDLGVDQFLDMSEGDVLEFQATKNDSPTSLATAEIMSVVEFY